MKFIKSVDYFLLLSPDLNIVNCSQNVFLVSKSLYGRPVTIGEELTVYIPQDFLISFMMAFKRVLQWEYLQVERILVFPNGAPVDLRIDLCPVGPAGAVQYVLMTIKNRLAHESLIYKQNRALARYAHLTSHKLRGPLSNILSLSDSLESRGNQKVDQGNIRKLLSDIRKQATHLDSVIYALNDLITNNDSTMPVRELSGVELRNLVLIDDEPFVNKIHERLFAVQCPGSAIYTFTDSEEALTWIIRSPADLIILDINMPILNGWDFLNELQNRNINTEVVIVSSSIDPEEKRKAFAYENVKYFLNKPLTRAHLSLMIKSEG